MTVGGAPDPHYRVPLTLMGVLTERSVEGRTLMVGFEWWGCRTDGCELGGWTLVMPGSSRRFASRPPRSHRHSAGRLNCGLCAGLTEEKRVGWIFGIIRGMGNLCESLSDRVRAGAEGQGGRAMMTVSLELYHKGLTLESPRILGTIWPRDGSSRAPSFTRATGCFRSEMV